MHFSMLVVIPKEQWMKSADLETDAASVASILEEWFEPYRESFDEGDDPWMEFRAYDEDGMSSWLYRSEQFTFTNTAVNEDEEVNWEGPLVDAVAAWQRAEQKGHYTPEYEQLKALVVRACPTFPIENVTALDIAACYLEYTRLPPCDEHPEGAWGYWRNAQGYWDWWQVGGRYSNQLPTKPHATLTHEFNSVALRKDVDHNAIVEKHEGYIERTLAEMEPLEEVPGYFKPAIFDNTLEVLGIPAVNQKEQDEARTLHRQRESLSILRELYPVMQRYSQEEGCPIDALDDVKYPSVGAFHRHVKRVEHLIEGEMDGKYAKVGALLERHPPTFPTLCYEKPSPEDLAKHTWFYDFCTFGVLDTEGWHTWEDGTPQENARSKHQTCLKALLEGDPLDLLLIVDFHC